MINIPKVSIIIPVYNAEKFLNKCLDSVINQTFKDIEIVCVNDGSKDNSLNILKEYQKKDNRIVIIDKANQGVSAARNDGIRKSTGEYITFVDSDDWLELDAIECVYNSITEKNVDVVKFNCYINTSYDEEPISSGNMCGLSGKLYSTEQEEFVEQVNIKVLKGELNCSVCLLMIHREILLKTSLFLDRIPYAEDCILFNELLNKLEKVYFLDKCLYHYYTNLESCTKSSKYLIRNIYSSARAYEKLVDIIEKDKFEEKNRIQVVTDRFGRIIMDSIFLIYLEKNTTRKEFIKLLKEFMNDKSIVDIIKKTNIDFLALHLKIPFILLSKNKFEKLFLFYKFRKFCRNVKEMIRKK